MSKKNNKTHKVFSWIKVISFILIFILVLEGLSTTAFSKANATKYNNKFSKAYNYVNEKDDTIDIVALGNSNLYSSLCPVKLWDNTGYTSTVIASARQTVAFSYSMLTEVMKKQSPKMIILEADMFYEGEDFDADPDESTSNKRVPTIPHLTDSQLTTDIENHFTVFLLHDRWKKMIGHATNTGDEATYNHGYYYNKTIKELKNNDNMNYSNKIDSLPYDAVVYLKKIVELCNQNDIQLMFYNSPSLRNWSYARHNAVAEYAEDNNAIYLDFNTLDDYEINFKTDFRDKGYHMNYFGAKKITSYIGDYIANNCPNLIEDKREDDNYSYWYDDKEKFIKVHEIKTF